MSRRRRNPYGSPAPQRRASSLKEETPVGFIDTIKGKVSDVEVRVRGLLDRLKYRYSDGVPAAYVGEEVFRPEEATFNLPTGQSFGGGTTPLVQYVVRDSVIHNVPIVMPAPGVFMARYITVEFYQRLYGGDLTSDGTFGDLNNLAGKSLKYAIPQSKPFLPRAGALGIVGVQQTGKVHLAANVPVESMGGDRYNMGVNFFWNLVDRDSDRRFSEDMVAGGVLMGQGFQGQNNGGLFEFGVPWLFERAGRMDFQFQLINPILQLAASSAEFPFTTPELPAGGVPTAWARDDWDDRENNGTTRNQEVTVRVEVHGTKFYSEKDLLLRESV